MYRDSLWVSQKHAVHVEHENKRHTKVIDWSHSRAKPELSTLTDNCPVGRVTNAASDRSDRRVTQSTLNVTVVAVCNAIESFIELSNRSLTNRHVISWRAERIASLRVYACVLYSALEIFSEISVIKTTVQTRWKVLWESTNPRESVFVANTWLHFTLCVAWWLSGRALDLRFTGRGFNSRPVAFT